MRIEKTWTACCLLPLFRSQPADKDSQQAAQSKAAAGCTQSKTVALASCPAASSFASIRGAKSPSLHPHYLERKRQRNGDRGIH